jgi:hypothetical protein
MPPRQPDQPLGRWLSMTDDSKGLAVEGMLTLEVEKAREAHALAKIDALSLSIGYRVAEDGASYDREGTRILKRVDLWEVSLVAMPANHRARITAVKAALLNDYGDPDVAVFEEIFRRFRNVSGRSAQRMASAAWATRNRNTQSTELDEIAALMRATGDSLTKGT